MNSIGEFFAKLGFDVDDKKLKQFDEGMKGLTTSFLAVVGGAFAAAEAIKAITANSIQSAQQLHNVSQQTGIAEDSIYSLAYAANHFNSSLPLEEAANQAQRLAENIKNIQKGSGDSSGYYWLGLRAKINSDGALDTDDLLRQLRQSYQEKYKQNPMQFTSAITSMGFDARILDTLKSTDAEFEKALQNAKQSQQIRDANAALGNSFNDLSVAIKQATDAMVAKYAPALMEITKTLQQNHPEMLAAVGAFQQMLPILLQLGEALAIIKFLGGFEVLAVSGGLIAGLTKLAIPLALIAGAVYEINKEKKEGHSDISDALEGVGVKIDRTPAGTRNRQLHSFGMIPDYSIPDNQRVTMGQYFRKLFGLSSPGTPADSGGSNEEDRLHKRLGTLFNQPPAAYTAPIGGAGAATPGNQSVNMNNNFYIDSKEDPDMVAKKVDEMLKRNWNHSLADINNGAVY